MVMRAKLRKIKNMKDELRKLSLVSQRFADKVPCDELMIFR